MARSRSFAALEPAASQLDERARSPRAAFIIRGREWDFGQKWQGGTTVWTPAGAPFSGPACAADSASDRRSASEDPRSPDQQHEKQNKKKKKKKTKKKK